VGITHRTVARVIAKDAAIADALATALTVAGPEGAKAFLHRFPDVVVSFSMPGGGSP
jgi:thiamine biosynthesis lipoprotein ApbE